MSKPDWTKAPEGATHWSPKDDEFKSCWWRKSDYVWECIIDNGYDKSWDSVTSMPSALIARDTNKPTWNGPEDGLPPVGVVCEVNSSKGWQCCEIVHNDGDVAVGLIREDGSTTVVGCEWSRQFGFRPLCTEEDKAVEEMLNASGEIFQPDHERLLRNAFTQLYRAGYRKEKQQ